MPTQSECRTDLFHPISPKAIFSLGLSLAGSFHRSQVGNMCHRLSPRSLHDGGDDDRDRGDGRGEARGKNDAGGSLAGIT